jgi:hypothetical protein
MKKNLFLLLCIVFANTLLKAQIANEFQTFNMANTPAFSGNNFKCVGIGKLGQIWAGTQYQGLYRYDTATKVWTKSTELTNVFINQIQPDKYGAIWIAQSGIAGVSGGGSNIAGGVNYFPNRTDAGMNFFSTSNFLSSRNVRGIYIDTVNTAPTNIKRLWIPQATFISSDNTKAGGITKWQDSITSNFQNVISGLQVFPNTNPVSTGTPSCYSVCGNKKEVWIAAETNYVIASGSTSQILRYDAITGQFLGGYDQKGAFDNTQLYYQDQPRVYTDKSMAGILPPGFRATAMYVDEEDRRWIGLRTGGVVVKMGNIWKSVNMPRRFIPGTTINFNAITSDEFGNIYFGTTNGLVVYDNGGEVTDTTFYQLLTTTEGLPSNNITGIVYDKAAGRMVITSDAGVTFWRVKYKIDVKLKWDYSFPYNKASQPIGVAADGVSRIYLKIKKRTDAPTNIKYLVVKLKDFSAARANTRGRLKKSLVIDRYSEEANNATVDSVGFVPLELKPGLPDEYWVWYKSPEDFSNDSLSAYAKLRRRFDTLRIIATYENDTKDTLDYKIGIVRPPTLFVHGLASAPIAWDSLKHPYFGTNITFLNSPLFTYKRALKMDPISVFQKNGAQLLGGDLSTYGYTEDRLNTLQGNLDAIREMRYAANQVDYVCHSMGGIMIRTAIGMYDKKFYAKAGDPFQYKTYGEGFVHKILTLNTPHNGSPVADIGFKLAPLFPKEILPAINVLYAYDPTLVGGFIKPVGNGGRFFGEYRVTDAVFNLQVSEKNGGVKMLETKAKNHLLTSNVNWVEYSAGVDKLEGVLPSLYNSFIQTLIAATYLGIPLEIFSDAPEQARANLLQLLAEQPQTRTANFLNKFALNRGYNNFMSYSDLIVPMQSQTARQNEILLPNISNVLGNDTTVIKIPIPVFTFINGLPVLLHTFYKTVNVYGLNGNHSAVLSRLDVGKKVFDLLNTKRSNNAFSDIIPANTDPEPIYFYRQATNTNRQKFNTIQAVTQSFYDTSKVKIDNPLRNGNVLADSIFQIKFRVKDTAKLLYYVVNYQVSDSFRINKSLSQQSIFFNTSPSFQNGNLITLMAAYTNVTNNGVVYYIDTISVNATNLATLQGFRINEDIAEIKVGELYYPIYEAKYNNQWVRLPFNDPGIVKTIDSLNVLKFDTLSKAFIGQSNGAAIANFTYNGFSDSLLVRVFQPYNANCINKSIVSGNLSNPAIWSKGVVPDICDSVIISTGHTVTVDTGLNVRALRINTGGTLTCNSSLDTLQIGEPDEHFANADIYGTFNMSNGAVAINGKIKFNTSSTFLMSGGLIALDANKGIAEMSVANGAALFEAAAGMTSFNFSGGTLQIVNPPYGAASQALNCPYDFGNNSTLVLGISTSTIASKNTDGFGGNLFPNKIGKLIINTGTAAGNRQFTTKKALNIKGNAEVRTGSRLVIQAPVTVNQ